MKTKLLKRLRQSAQEHIGVFRNENGSYEVVFDKNRFYADVSKYGEDEFYDRNFQVLEKGVETLDEAKDMCDFYRRVFILRQVREIKYGNTKRFY